MAFKQGLLGIDANVILRSWDRDGVGLAVEADEAGGAVGAASRNLPALGKGRRFGGRHVGGDGVDDVVDDGSFLEPL